MTDDAFQTGPVDKIASSTAPCGIDSPITLSPYVVAQHGYVVVVRALDEKDQYDEVECSDGAFRHIREGDVLVGTLGGRQALKGYSGRVPATLPPAIRCTCSTWAGSSASAPRPTPTLGRPCRWRCSAP
jgi:hypothetical protein